MNIEYFKAAIATKFKSQEDFATSIGINRRTLQNWFTSNNIPKGKLFSILSSLDLDEREEDILLDRPKLQMVFRAKYKKTTSEENKRVFSSFAETFMKLNGTSYSLSEEFPRLAKPYSLKTIVGTLRNLLALKESEPAKLFEVLEKLKEFNVNTIFFPFNKLGLEIELSTKEVAFTAFKEEKIIIFLDANRTFDESLFDLLHELAHIICNHVPENTTKEDETLCNSVAQELIYPHLFFTKNEKLKEFFQNFSYVHINKVREVFKLLTKDFDWSPIGIALSFSTYGFIQRDSSQYRNLMSINKQLKENNKTITDLFFENLVTSDLEKLLTFFSSDIYKSKDIYKGFLELKNGATFGHLSPRWMSEIFNVNPGDMDEIVRVWRDEDQIILSQEADQSDSEAN
jgi:Zn-dependent peptidase ImmA (M78 family)